MHSANKSAGEVAVNIANVSKCAQVHVRVHLYKSAYAQIWVQCHVGPKNLSSAVIRLSERAKTGGFREGTILGFLVCFTK